MKRTMLFAAAMLLSGGVLAQTVIIDPSVFSAGTDVTTTYPGVRLETAEGTSQVYFLEVLEPLHLISDLTAPVYVNATGNRFAHAASDVWSANSLCCGNQTNALKISFAKPVTSVAVLFDAGDDTAILQVYDRAGVLLAETYQRLVGPGTVSLDAPAKEDRVCVGDVWGYWPYRHRDVHLAALREKISKGREGSATSGGPSPLAGTHCLALHFPLATSA